MSHMREELQEANKKMEKIESDKWRENIANQGFPLDTDNPIVVREAMEVSSKKLCW